MPLPAGMREAFLDEQRTLAVIEIETPACRARVALQGAQVLQMQPAGQPPLLWLSPGARFAAGKAVRGGIPLCFPWFGAHPHDHARPAHGFARTAHWRLLSAAVEDGGVAALAFELGDDEQTRACWPHAFRAELAYRFSQSLSVTLRVSNTGPAPFAFGFAWHNYLPVSDIARVRIEGLEGVSFADKLAPGKPPASEALPVRIAAETDRVYQGTAGRYRLLDEAAGLSLQLAAEGCSNAVLWNPWQEKAARLGDVPDDAWRRFVCLECGNTGPADVRVPPGATRVFTQTLAWQAQERPITP